MVNDLKIGINQYEKQKKEWMRLEYVDSIHE